MEQKAIDLLKVALKQYQHIKLQKQHRQIAIVDKVRSEKDCIPLTIRQFYKIAVKRLLDKEDLSYYKVVWRPLL